MQPAQANEAGGNRNPGWSVLFDTETVPTRRELVLDLAAFGGTVIAAVVQDWKAADIVWASWITSVQIGLSFFLTLSLKKL